jgi:glutaredoxin-like YruB-family protein
VVLFSTPSCSWCNRAKSYFRQHRIRFKDVDVSRDPRAAKDMQRKTGQMGVPVILIGSNRPIIGFDKATIDRLLGIRA